LDLLLAELAVVTFFIKMNFVLLFGSDFVGFELVEEQCFEMPMDFLVFSEGSFYLHIRFIG
jgi:hypothetical protein